jgi:hypothetical protein
MKTKHVSPDTLHHALEGDRESALAMWKQVAAHPSDPESILWVQAVAQRLLDADGVADRRRRPDAVLKAVGLFGQRDRHRLLREQIETLKHFENLDRAGPPARGEKSQELFNYVRALPEFDEYLRELPTFKQSGRTLEVFKAEQLTDDDIRKIVDRITQ